MTAKSGKPKKKSIESKAVRSKQVKANLNKSTPKKPRASRKGYNPFPQPAKTFTSFTNDPFKPNKLDPETKKILRNKLKAANTRLQRLEDYYGADSATAKNQYAFFTKGPLYDYLGESASGHTKIDIPKVLNSFESGEMNIDEFNEVLRHSAGVFIGSDQQIHKSNYHGFQSIGEIKQSTLDAVIGSDENPYDYPDEELKKLTNTLNEIRENFQTVYDDASIPTSTMKSDPIIKMLYSEPDKKRGKLSYDDLEKITNRMIELQGDLNGNEKLKNGDKAKKLIKKLTN